MTPIVVSIYSISHHGRLILDYLSEAIEQEAIEVGFTVAHSASDPGNENAIFGIKCRIEEGLARIIPQEDEGGAYDCAIVFSLIPKTPGGLVTINNLLSCLKIGSIDATVFMEDVPTELFDALRGQKATYLLFNAALSVDKEGRVTVRSSPQGIPSA